MCSSVHVHMGEVPVCMLAHTVYGSGREDVVSLNTFTFDLVAKRT